MYVRIQVRNCVDKLILINDLSPEDENIQGYVVVSVLEKMKGSMERNESSVETKNVRGNDDSDRRIERNCRN